MPNNELVPTEQKEQSGFLTLRQFDIGGAMSEELAGLDGGFERIKIPSAGSTLFEVPGEDGEPDAVKEFSAVILHHHPLFAYYRQKYSGGNNPPDCGSYDGVTGTGTPGGTCATCSFNQFGTGENGAKACKNRRRVYVLREGEIFPLLLSLPTGSLREFGRYIKRVLSKGHKSSQVVTRFSLTKATNTGGVVYSQAAFAMERALTDEEAQDIAALAEQVKRHALRVAYDAEPAVELGEVIDPETGEVTMPL